jgi:hypothetical protein
MNKLYFWLGLALLGFLLYVAPGFLVRRMYEGFETSVAANAADANAIGGSLLTAAATPTTPLLDKLASAGAEEPDSRPSPTAPTPIVGSSGSRAVPTASSTSLSQPSSTRELPQESEALKQGTGFLDSKPFPAELDVEQKSARVLGMEGAVNPAVVQGFQNPSCPDMRDYIRKDKIPCWACNLR